MMDLSIKKFNKGVSLTEVVVAIALVSLCIGGILSVAVQSLDLERGIDYLHTATNIAKSRIERIRQIRKENGYAAVALTAEPYTAVNSNGVSDANGDFERATSIDTAAYPGLTAVTVSVKYKRSGVFNSQPIVLTALISQYM